ncbi:hypothetical protein [Amycolatopsis sp. cmx-4-68]|uniref:hypothetical protein n=1 Tax=Amycolatopsis sp. cmx-4-68 TaxID=2790938 RepID=UPI00397922A1
MPPAAKPARSSRRTWNSAEPLAGIAERIEQVRTAAAGKAAATGDVVDERLWTAVAKTTGAAGNSTALVGSYEQVADSLPDYVRLGVGTLLIRGFSPPADARDYGTLVKLVRDRSDAVTVGV